MAPGPDEILIIFQLLNGILHQSKFVSSNRWRMETTQQINNHQWNHNLLRIKILPKCRQTKKRKKNSNGLFDSNEMNNGKIVRNIEFLNKDNYHKWCGNQTFFFDFIRENLFKWYLFCQWIKYNLMLWSTNEVYVLFIRYAFAQSIEVKSIRSIRIMSCVNVCVTILSNVTNTWLDLLSWASKAGSIQYALTEYVLIHSHKHNFMPIIQSLSFYFRYFNAFPFWSVVESDVISKFSFHHSRRIENQSVNKIWFQCLESKFKSRKSNHWTRFKSAQKICF